jgi:hypothetical protein
MLHHSSGHVCNSINYATGWNNGRRLEQLPILFFQRRSILRRNATDDPATDERKVTLVNVDEFARDARTPMPVNEGSLGH